MTREAIKIIVEILRGEREIGNIPENLLEDVIKNANEMGILHSIFSIDIEKIERDINFIKELKKYFDFIVIKGISLLPYYNGKRYSRDIDILIPFEEYKKVEKILQDIGMIKYKRSRIRNDFETLHVQEYIKGDIEVGVHWFLCDPFLAKIRFEDVETQKIKIKNVVIKTLTPEWHIINLSLHLFQHLFPLRIFLDISKVIPYANINKVMEISKKHKIEKIVYFSISTTIKLFKIKKENVIINQENINLGALEIFSLLFSSPLWFIIRRKIFKIPYLDKLISLSLSQNLGKIKNISLKLIFTDFLERLKGEYATTY